MGAKVSAGYMNASRAPRYSVLFALPLFLLYEALAAGLADEPGAHVRNAADVALTTAFGLTQLDSFRVGTVEVAHVI